MYVYAHIDRLHEYSSESITQITIVLCHDLTWSHAETDSSHILTFTNRTHACTCGVM